MTTITTALAGSVRTDDDYASFGRGAAITARTPPLVPASGPVVALNRRPTVALGGLTSSSTIVGTRYVTAYTVDGTPCWIPGEAVWSDAATCPHPSSPHPVGLATASSRERALLAGLSDRLGWEAMHEFDGARDMSLVDLREFRMSVSTDDIAVLDGRLVIDIPTVVVIGEDILRWGAGASWEAALQRAMYRHASTMEPEDELEQLSTRLGEAGFTLVSVDLGSPLLRQAGVHRHSVQLLAT